MLGVFRISANFQPENWPPTPFQKSLPEESLARNKKQGLRICHTGLLAEREIRKKHASAKNADKKFQAETGTVPGRVPLHDSASSVVTGLMRFQFSRWESLGALRTRKTSYVGFVSWRFKVHEKLLEHCECENEFCCVRGKMLQRGVLNVLEHCEHEKWVLASWTDWCLKKYWTIANMKNEFCSLRGKMLQSRIHVTLFPGRTLLAPHGLFFTGFFGRTRNPKKALDVRMFWANSFYIFRWRAGEFLKVIWGICVSVCFDIAMRALSKKPNGNKWANFSVLGKNSPSAITRKVSPSP